MDAGDPGIDELSHRPHRMQRLAKAGAGIRDNGDSDRFGDVARDPHLLVEGQQRFRCAARAAGDKPANIGRLEARLLDEPPTERVIGDRQMQERLLG
jgi:hypothetical protein